MGCYAADVISRLSPLPDGNDTSMMCSSACGIRGFILRPSFSLNHWTVIRLYDGCSGYLCVANPMTWNQHLRYSQWRLYQLRAYLTARDSRVLLDLNPDNTIRWCQGRRSCHMTAGWDLCPQNETTILISQLHFGRIYFAWLSLSDGKFTATQRLGMVSW